MSVSFSVLISVFSEILGLVFVNRREEGEGVRESVCETEQEMERRSDRSRHRNKIREDTPLSYGRPEA